MDKNINSTGSCKPFINLSWNIVAYCFLVHKKNFHSLPTICDHLCDVLLHCQNDIHDFPPKRARCLVSDVKININGNLSRYRLWSSSHIAEDAIFIFMTGLYQSLSSKKAQGPIIMSGEGWGSYLHLGSIKTNFDLQLKRTETNKKHLNTHFSIPISGFSFFFSGQIIKSDEISIFPSLP